MKLVLSNGEVIDNVTASEKRIEIPFETRTQGGYIYSMITNETLKGARVETSSGNVILTYGDIAIQTSRMELDKKWVYILTDARSAEGQQMKQRIEELELELEKERETFTESIDELTASVNESIDTLMTEILPSLEDMIYSSLEDNKGDTDIDNINPEDTPIEDEQDDTNVDDTGKDVEEGEPIENTNNVGENNVVAESEEG